MGVIFTNFCIFLFRILLVVLVPLAVVFAIFGFSCFCWYLFYRYRRGMVRSRSSIVRPKKRPLLVMLFFDLPRRMVLDYFQRSSDFFDPHGIHIFCGEQGSGKSIACVEMMLRLRKMYPHSKMLTNFAVTGEDIPLAKWQQLLTFSNGHNGVIVGIDEIQNWFMSGKNQLPEGMLEIVTQNRKNRRIICCTAQVFTRVSKAIREQVTLVYEPHTFFHALTVVLVFKYSFDSEGNIDGRKLRRIYSFVHTDELRSAYDTYKVIHTLAKEGFKQPVAAPVANVYLDVGKRK